MTELEEIKGVGASIAEQLKQAGITSAEDLSVRDPEEIKALLNCSLAKAKKLITAAKDVTVNAVHIYTGEELNEERKSKIQRISTNSSELDKIFGGGVPTDALTAFTGQFACIPYNTWIAIPTKTLKNGKKKSFIELRYLKEGDSILAIDENGNLVEDRVIYKKRRRLFYDEPFLTIVTNEGHELTVTGNHPVLTEHGFVRAMDLKVGDHIICLDNVPEKYKRHSKFLIGGVTSGSWKKGHKFTEEEKRKMSEARKRFFREHPERAREISRKGAISLRKKLLRSIPKSQIETLKKVFGIELEHPIKLPDRLVISDIAIPSKKIAIFSDGEYWHKDREKDIEDTNKLIEAGWTVYRITDSSMNSNIPKVSIEFKDPVIVEIREAQRINYVWDIGTENHHTFIANGIVTHNTGKTQLCKQLVVNMKKQYNRKSVWIETEPQTCILDRIKQIAIANGINFDLKNDIYVIPAKFIKTPVHLFKAYEMVERLITDKKEDIGLIVIDSFNAPFRAAYAGRETLGKRSAESGRHIGFLQQLASQYNIAIVMTLQVMGVPDSGQQLASIKRYGIRDAPVAAHVVKHGVNFLVSLEQVSANDKTWRAIIADGPVPRNECTFIIDETGIRDFTKRRGV